MFFLDPSDRHCNAKVPAKHGVHRVFFSKWHSFPPYFFNFLCNKPCTTRVSMEVSTVTIVSKLIYNLFRGLTTYIGVKLHPFTKYQQDIPVNYLLRGAVPVPQSIQRLLNSTQLSTQIWMILVSNWTLPETNILGCPWYLVNG